MTLTIALCNACDVTSRRLLSDVVDRESNVSAFAVLLNLIDDRDMDDGDLRRLFSEKLREKRAFLYVHYRCVADKSC